MPAPRPTARWLRFLPVALAAAGLGVGVYFAVQAGAGEDTSEPTPTTAATLVPTEPPAMSPPGGVSPPDATGEPSTPTEGAPTEPPPPPADTPTLVPTPYPTLPPPPPRPDNPTPVGDYNLPGGQWYQLRECMAFYLPTDWTYVLHVAVANPDGAIIAFEEPSTQSGIVFSQHSLAELSRTVNDDALNPVFDQIADTITSTC